MGPWWDYNIALGNANYCEGEQTEGFQLNDNGCFDFVPFGSVVCCSMKCISQGWSRRGLSIVPDRGVTPPCVG